VLPLIEHSEFNLYTVKPPIFPTSKTSNPLVIPVFAEPPHLTYGKSLQKFYTSYSFQFQDIPWTLIQEKVVFYHSSQWKIVYSYVCLERTLLFEFILSTQFSVHHIQVLCKISFSLNHYEISLESQLCLVGLCQDPSPFPSPLYFLPCAAPYLLELSEVSLYSAIMMLVPRRVK